MIKVGEVNYCILFFIAVFYTAIGTSFPFLVWDYCKYQWCFVVLGFSFQKKGQNESLTLKRR